MAVIEVKRPDGSIFPMDPSAAANLVRQFPDFKIMGTRTPGVTFEMALAEEAYWQTVGQPDVEKERNFAYSEAQKLGITPAPLPASVYGPMVIIPDADVQPLSPVEPARTQEPGPGQLATTASSEETTTQDSVPGGQRMSVLEETKALARDSGYTSLTWDQWNWFAEQATGKSGMSPESAGIQRVDPMPTMSAAEWWEKAGSHYTVPEAATTTGGPVAEGERLPVGVIDQLIGLVRQMLSVLLAARKG